MILSVQKVLADKWKFTDNSIAYDIPMAIAMSISRTILLLELFRNLIPESNSASCKPTSTVAASKIHRGGDSCKSIQLIANPSESYIAGVKTLIKAKVKTSNDNEEDNLIKKK